jgi:hypothetical protein
MSLEGEFFIPSTTVRGQAWAVSPRYTVLLAADDLFASVGSKADS